MVDNEDIKSGFQITFKWADNPYFTNDVLQKTFAFAPDGTLEVAGTHIEWKENMVRHYPSLPSHRMVHWRPPKARRC